MEGTRFVLIGRAGSGKDTVADYLIENYGFKQYSFAAKLKEIAQDLFPCRLAVDRRNLLQQLGLKLREISEDVWVNYLLKTIYEEDESRAIITDCRFQNEYDICTKQGFIPVKINCDDNIRADRLFKRDGKRMSFTEMSHISEQLNVPCDFYLDNNGTYEFLYEQIDKMMQEVTA